MSRLPTAVSISASTLRIRVRVKPNASASRIIAVLPDRVDIAIPDPARNGEANEGAIRFVCSVLGYGKSCAAIVAGGKSRDKVLAVERIVGSDAGEKEKGEVVGGVLERLRDACGR